MAQIRNGQEAMLNRNQYNSLKRMDRDEAESFVRAIYDKGYDRGVIDAESKHLEEATRKTAAGAVDNRKQIIDELLLLFGDVAGVGPATLKKIQAALNKWGERV